MTQKVMDLGAKDAENVIRMGPGNSFEHFHNYVHPLEARFK